MSVEELENILEVYTLEEIAEFNDLSVVDVLQFLVDQEFIELPEILPI
jgi:hypothetical protein